MLIEAEQVRTEGEGQARRRRRSWGATEKRRILDLTRGRLAPSVTRQTLLARFQEFR